MPSAVHDCSVRATSRYRQLSTWYGQNRHYLHGLAWEDYEVRMVFEELRGGFVRFRANDHIRSHLVAYILNAAVSDLLGLAERSTHADNRALVLFDPRLPCGNSLAFLCPPLRFRKGVPRRHLPAGFAPKKNSEICFVRAHDGSFLLRFAAEIDILADA
jgi:hypothetical protein